jgi:hypothetical protein
MFDGIMHFHFGWWTVPFSWVSERTVPIQGSVKIIMSTLVEGSEKF